ncbi:MAG: SIS domain-containing protein [Methanoregulaceae archaeon]|nr:SIS domain-containing protein [Methanoregulaceae archaeon]
MIFSAGNVPICSYVPAEKPLAGMKDEVSRILSLMDEMGKTIRKSSRLLDRSQVLAFRKEILSVQRVYTAGAGRSGFIAKAFGMRLMHLGFESYVVGETITPPLRPGDTLVVVSGSGETQSMVSICETAKGLGGRVFLITASPDSRIGLISDGVVNLGDLTGYYREDRSTFELRQLTGEYRSVTTSFAPLGTLFETLALVFTDAVVSSLIEAREEKISTMKGRLTNVE